MIKVDKLKENREIVWNSIKHMEGTIKSTGTFYYFVKLPNGVSDLKAGI